MRALAFGLAIFLTAHLANAQGGQPPAPKVAVAAAYSKMIVEETVFLGRGEAVDKADIVARVDGFLQEKLVADGEVVPEGQPLFRIEADRYRNELAAKRADLARAEANLQLANAELSRKAKLVARGSTSISEFDVAKANVAVAEANVASARAAIQQAELNLSYTEITAPFPGRVGRSKRSIGEIVNSTTGPLTTLVRERPIFVSFSLNEKQMIEALERVGGGIAELTEGAQWPDVFVTLQNGTVLEETGQIVFIDNRIDPATGTIAFRAEFPNEKGFIVDGGFMSVRIKSPESTERLLVPQAAVQRDQRGEFVLVVNQQQTVEQRYIEVGPEQGLAVIVLSGLQEGEAVIVEGLQRVRPGVPVEAVLTAVRQE